MIQLEEAREIVFAACGALPERRVLVADASGCVLTRPATAEVAVPPFANSAMDGYAVRAADVAAAPAALQVVGRVLAGGTAQCSLGAGQAIRIMTGAPIPHGADAVCMIELTRVEDGGERVVIERAVAPGEHLRDAGGDVRPGEVVLDAGAYVGATQLAALVSAGVSAVTVRARPRVGVISTGDELVDPGKSLGPAQIYDSNRPMLVALIAEAGCAPVDLGRSSDREEDLRERIEQSLGDVDALVLSGGVSVGDADVVRTVLDSLGGEHTRWMQIAIRPAKPFSFSVLSADRAQVPAFGLPGNPVSSAVSFELLVRPALRRMAGHRVIERPRVSARVENGISRTADGRLYFVRVRLDTDEAGDWVATPVAGQGSHQIRSMAVADGLALVPDGEGIPRGGRVEVVVTNAALGGSFASAPTGSATPRIA